MNNNVNGNNISNVNPANTVGTPQVNPGNVVNPGVTNGTVVNPGMVVNNVGGNIPVNTQNYVNNPKPKMKKIYVVLIVGVVLVLAVAFGLLYFLLSGTIGRRNRLYCTKVVQEDNYLITTNNVYKFEKKIYTRVDSTYNLSYTITLTDDMYNETFGSIIDDNHGVSQYGFGTEIEKDGNKVIITAYNVNFDKSITYDVLKQSLTSEGYVCE